MKIKYLLISLFTLFTLTDINAQCETGDCDPEITSMSFASACTDQGNTVLLTVNWSFNSASGSCMAPAGSWAINIQLPLTDEYGVVDAMTVGGTTGSDFDWTYDAGNRKLIGVSNRDIGVNIPPNPMPWFVDGGDIEVTVTANTVTDCANPVVSNSNITVFPDLPIFPDACPEAFSNDALNDSQATQMGVSLVLPVRLVAFDAKNIDCEENELTWMTTNETDNSGFEILRSFNGMNFDKINFVQPNQPDHNGFYHYAYSDKEIAGYNGKIYYRIKQVDLDGHSEIFEIRSVSINCIDPAEMTIYPNPAINTLNYSMSSFYTGKDLKIEIVGTDGKTAFLKNIQDIEELEKQIDISEIPAGSYRVRFISDQEIQDFSFIKLK